MRIVDANVLLCAVNRSSAHHEAARGWLDEALGAREPVGLAWVALLAFVRLSTHGSVFPRPLAVDDAMTVVDAWLESPAAVVVNPTGRHASVLRGLLHGIGTGGNVTTDAHLAALAVEHGATVVSFDRDFDRFNGVRWQVPTGG